MIQKYYIGVSAQSKGYFKGWKISYFNAGSRVPNELKNADVPAFTKQTALATGYDTELEATAAVTIIRDYTVARLSEQTAMVTTFQRLQSEWIGLTDDEKFAAYEAYKFPIHGQIYYHRNTPSWKVDVLKLIRVYDFTEEIRKREHFAACYTKRLKFIDDGKLVVRLVDCEIKFLDSERRTISWVVRGDNATASAYCNCCGGSVPSIPQLVIGSTWGKYSCIICAICMEKLADEAKLQSTRIPDEIREQYMGDRFLRDMG